MATPAASAAGPVRKKIDGRVKTLLENGVKVGHRSFFVIVGDRAREQVSGPCSAGVCTCFIFSVFRL
jgi:hypothetical protein